MTEHIESTSETTVEKASVPDPAEDKKVETPPTVEKTTETVTREETHE